MGLQPTFGPGVYASASVFRLIQNTPLRDHPLATHREPSALYCWILEIPASFRRALLRIPFAEGRSICLCWAKSKPKGPKKEAWPFYRTSSMSAYVGSSKNLNALKDEILYYDPKQSRAFLRTLSTEGRGVCLSWAIGSPGS